MNHVVDDESCARNFRHVLPQCITSACLTIAQKKLILEERASQLIGGASMRLKAQADWARRTFKLQKLQKALGIVLQMLIKYLIEGS